MQMWKNPEESLENKTKVKAIIEKWLRPIFRKEVKVRQLIYTIILFTNSIGIVLISNFCIYQPNKAAPTNLTISEVNRMAREKLKKTQEMTYADLDEDEGQQAYLLVHLIFSMKILQILKFSQLLESGKYIHAMRPAPIAMEFTRKPESRVRKIKSIILNSSSFPLIYFMNCRSLLQMLTRKLRLLLL